MSILPLPPAPRPPRLAHTPPSVPDGCALPQGRVAVMGILNVTPDSFSDGGRYTSYEAALSHAHRLREEGADIIDVGGESTRLGSTRITPDEEWARIGQVVSLLAGQGVPVSVDTLHASTARRAADAGAAFINDVSGGRWDPAMNRAVASSQCAYVIQHYRALPGGAGESFDYGSDLVGTLSERIFSQVRDALDAGVDPTRIIVDPGLGFSLTNEQCWQILSELDRLGDIGFPLLVGASRKRFVKALGGDIDADTAAISAYCADAGVWAVRVHDVARTVAALARKDDTP